MHRTILALVSIFVLALMLFPATAAEAHARDNWVAVYSVTNRTSTTLYYSIKWGEDGEWKEFCVHPGESWNHSWKYDFANENRSPRAYVRFDADLTSGTCWVEYRVYPYAAPYSSYECSKKYVFQYSGSSGVDLKYVN